MVGEAILSVILACSIYCSYMAPHDGCQDGYQTKREGLQGDSGTVWLVGDDVPKKKTILMSEDPSEVTKGSLWKNITSSMKKRVKPKHLGIGGTIGQVKRNGDAPVKLEWGISYPKDRGRRYRKDLLRSKVKAGAGFNIGVRF
jgi:hypothetical protein